MENGAKEATFYPRNTLYYRVPRTDGLTLLPLSSTGASREAYGNACNGNAFSRDALTTKTQCAITSRKLAVTLRRNGGRSFEMARCDVETLSRLLWLRVHDLLDLSKI